MRKRDIVKEYIREKINKEEYKPGQKIMSEPLLAEYLNISRSTVREALKELAFEGVIDKEKGNGTFIKDNSDVLSKKEFILIVSSSDSTEGYIRDNYRYLLNNIKEAVLERGYKPICFINNDLVNLQESMTEILNKTAGIITFIAKKEDVNFIKTLKNIPVCDTMRTVSGVFPSVIIDYYSAYREFVRLMDKYEPKNSLVFSINHYNENYSALKNYFVAFPFEGEKVIFSDYDFHSVDFFTREDLGLGQIREVLDNLKEVPDSVVFIDDYLFRMTYPLFDEYNHIFSKTKIITQANDKLMPDDKYKICRIVFDFREIAAQTADLLVGQINKEFLRQPNIFIKPQVRDEKNLL
ncbi:MAG: GntR family transcriptional regulator [Armatimonadetes bacterium]|nr:GntR family transcriptional regulator [Candidatus Hippobium faecium]